MHNEIELKEFFDKKGYLIFRNFLSKSCIQRLLCDVNALYANSVRKNMLVDDGVYSTRRKLRVINSKVIKEISPEIIELYHSDKLLGLVSRLTGKNITPYSDSLESCVLNILEEEGDCHGWHKDTFPYVLNIAIEVPNKNKGGVVEVKEKDYISDIFLEKGDAYLLKSNKLPHRVTSLKENTKRWVISLAYVDTEFSESCQIGVSYSRALYK